MDTPYRILIADRNYSSWSFENVDTDLPVEPPSMSDFHPLKYKLFSKDVFCVLENTKIKILHSVARSVAHHAGVLQLADGKTYGRANKKRLLYKCIPDDKFLPAFLVPYEVQLGFAKNISNKFVVFKFDTWIDKHPHGVLVETLGDVTVLEAFYEYQLYCKSLHDSITRLTQDARAALNQAPIDSYIAQIRTRCETEPPENKIFSIDPPHSLDFDDAVSIRPLGGGGWNVCIYIANVVVWIEVLDLWKSLTNRVATIYLPDRRRPMLPTVLSDSLCSLQENQDRFAFVCDMTIQDDVIVSTVFRHAHVRVAKNYRYEEAALFQLPDYQDLLAVTQRLDKSCKDSHDVVAFWMIEVNSRCAAHLYNHRQGIFRSVIFQEREKDVDVNVDLKDLSDECRRTIQLWNNTTGQYTWFSQDALQHDVLKRAAYVHMTSPIRRLVDLLNQMLFLREFLGVSLSPAAETFFETWLQNMNHINVSMRSIRKVQNDCQLVHRCTQDPTLLEGTHRCVVFDRIERGSGYFNYMVYMESLSLLSKIRVTRDLENYQTVDCKLLVFENEEKTKRKIRLCLV
jgi:hypothetical protein